MSEAHEAALQAGPDDYDAVMEEYIATHLGPSYWAQVWPSALALGQRLLARPRLAEGKRVLELGCGLGLASVCAAQAGARSVLATDIEENALAFTAANAAANEVDAVVSVQRLDWAAAGGSGGGDGGGGNDAYDLVLCADVVYDESAPPLLASLLHTVVAEGGCVLLTDNADRPYANARREALLGYLTSSGEFELVPPSEDVDEPERSSTAQIELESRQGSSFTIAHCELVRSG